MNMAFCRFFFALLIIVLLVEVLVAPTKDEGKKARPAKKAEAAKGKATKTGNGQAQTNDGYNWGSHDPTLTYRTWASYGHGDMDSDKK
ncbi:hypothetical protein DdX_19664 [Ditylenchus destructor]|uniref:Uncharacterized protein n=1 Tax=Ditylenchus destructor TaxID=166010 RepID=A0AAD4MMS7_9BILA|nr:hypothetical protein DdX_19664 [Ditylenchus destructor]